ncbi:hypothetical protein DAH55_12610 [Sphingomonas koreensis]|uniref:hypothetical protein n=1 Tax=Sphingomonas koreensis TaxID=93064 RepID=UPI000831584E|nr:hypothetical protein [Sphingomonas koreensis]RSU58984.1 hypothetical protein DAH56_13195 [Sphingomonas koreensis]RSU67536.1 hypothetical protein DAH55_12610 [Sphingomonas koreensis]
MPALLRTELATASRERLLHYLAGHLMALTNQEEPLTAGRLDGIMEHVAALNVRLADSIRIELNK